MSSNPVIALAGPLLFPLAAALLLTFATQEAIWYERKRLLHEPVSESDLRNEWLEPAFPKLTAILLFAVFFNLAYLTVNATTFQDYLLKSTAFYVASLVLLLVGLFVVLAFHFRFSPRRFYFLSISFSLSGTIVLLTALSGGFAQGSATGSSTASSTALTLLGVPAATFLPYVLVGTTWALAVAAFLLELRPDRHLPGLRIPDRRAYRLFLAGLFLSWAGVLLFTLPPLLRTL